MTPVSIRLIIILLTFAAFVLMLNQMISLEAGIIIFVLLLIIYGYIKNVVKNKKASK
jgi:hypothetical protein